MDQVSMNIMKSVVDKYELKNKIVVDLGSYDINGTYKSLFNGKYVGVDIIPGPNVDILVDSPEWQTLDNVDAVISGQTLEHIANIPEFMSNIMRILKPGGIVCIIVPSSGPRHDYPIWVGNFSEGDLYQIFKEAGFDVLSTSLDSTLPWCLASCVGKKPDIKAIKQLKSAARKDEDEGK